MSRYIDADAVITAIAEFNKYEDELEYPYASDDLEEYKDDARLLIEDAPSIEIVRCKECKWSKANGTYQWCGRLDSTARITADDFCSYGERREQR